MEYLLPASRQVTHVPGLKAGLCSAKQVREPDALRSAQIPMLNRALSLSLADFHLLLSSPTFRAYGTRQLPETD